jgi:hypothetical protein
MESESGIGEHHQPAPSSPLAISSRAEEAGGSSHLLRHARREMGVPGVPPGRDKPGRPTATPMDTPRTALGSSENKR